MRGTEAAHASSHILAENGSAFKAALMSPFIRQVVVVQKACHRAKPKLHQYTFVRHDDHPGATELSAHDELVPSHIAPAECRLHGEPDRWLDAVEQDVKLIDHAGKRHPITHHRRFTLMDCRSEPHASQRRPCPPQAQGGLR